MSAAEYFGARDEPVIGAVEPEHHLGEAPGRYRPLFTLPELDGDAITVTSALADTDGDGQVDDNLPVGVATPIFGRNASDSPVAAGTITLNANGTYTFDPLPTYVGEVPVRYTVSDPGGRIEGRVRPHAMRRWPGNGGAEAMLRFPDGRFLILAEGARGKTGGTAALTAVQFVRVDLTAPASVAAMA